MIFNNSKIHRNDVIEADGNRIYHIDEFFQYYDEDFVRFCYVSVLKRLPDSSGFDFYLQRIRNGDGRESVLLDLIKSAEGRLKKVKIIGADKYFILSEAMRFPFLGGFIAFCLFVLTFRKHLMDLRALENHCYRMNKKIRM